MLLPGYLSAKPAATASSVGFCVGSSPVPRQQYQRRAAGSNSGTASVWAAVGAATDSAGAADSPAAGVAGTVGVVDWPQADTRMAPTASRTSSLVVRGVRIDRSSSGAFRVRYEPTGSSRRRPATSVGSLPLGRFERTTMRST